MLTNWALTQVRFTVPLASNNMNTRSPVVAVVGLGYVGLPLAVEFGKSRPTIGFDLSERKVAAYRRFEDPTGEVSSEQLRAATLLNCTTDG